MIEWNEARFAFLINQDGMSLRESPALTILSRETNGMALINQSAKGQGFAHRPVNIGACFDHLLAAFHKTLNGFMDIETFGHIAEAIADKAQFIKSNTSGAAPSIIGAIIGRLQACPTPIQPIRLIGLIALSRFEFTIKLFAPRGDL